MLMAAMSKPKLLLLDEHTAALDPKTSMKIMEITEKILKETNITTMMVTHNLKQAIKTGNRLIMMHRGKILIDVKGDEKTQLTTEKLMNLFKDANINDDLSNKKLISLIFSRVFVAMTILYFFIFLCIYYKTKWKSISKLKYR